MNNPSSNNQRNMRRAVALLAIVLALLSCFRLCRNMPLGELIPREVAYVQGEMQEERA